MNIGDYELSLVDVTIIFLTLIILKRLFCWMRRPMIATPTKYDTKLLERQDLTRDQVETLRRDEQICLVVVGDKIYDMSPSRDLYEMNRGSLESLDGCGPEWEELCQRKFAFVGKLID